MTGQFEYAIKRSRVEDEVVVRTVAAVLLIVEGTLHRWEEGMGAGRMRIILRRVKEEAGA